MSSTTNRLPIVFFHRLEPSSYLIASVLQARFTNPCSPIILFHDFAETPADLRPHNIICIHMRDFYGECARLDKIWFNISRNRSEHELGSFQRWMVLRNYLRDSGISSCFAADSDLLIYCDIAQAKQPFESSDFTIAEQTWSSLFVNNIRVLDLFHDFILEAFERKTNLWWKTLAALNIYDTSVPIGNLADTVLIRLFVNDYAASHGLRWQNTAEIYNGSAFCPDLRSDFLPCELELQSQDPFDPRPVRKIFWQNGLPFAQLKDSGEYVRLNVLHFRGFLKHTHLIPCFADFLQHLQKQSGFAQGSLGLS